MHSPLLVKRCIFVRQWRKVYLGLAKRSYYFGNCCSYLCDCRILLSVLHHYPKFFQIPIPAFQFNNGTELTQNNCVCNEKGEELNQKIQYVNRLYEGNCDFHNIVLFIKQTFKDTSNNDINVTSKWPLNNQKE